jgi:hypothetical protein
MESSEWRDASFKLQHRYLLSFRATTVVALLAKARKFESTSTTLELGKLEQNTGLSWNAEKTLRYIFFCKFNSHCQCYFLEL